MSSADLARRESIDLLQSVEKNEKRKVVASAKGDVQECDVIKGNDVTKWTSIGSESSQTATSFGYQSISPDRKNSVESR